MGPGEGECEGEEKGKENVALIHDRYGWPPTTHRANIWPGPLECDCDWDWNRDHNRHLLVVM